MKRLVFILISLCVLVLGADEVLVSHKEAKMSQRQEIGGVDYTKENEINDSLQIDKIMKLYRKMYTAIIEKDLDTIVRIFANDFVMLYLNGKNMNKNEYMSVIREGSLGFSYAKHDDIVVTVHGDRATLCGKSFVDIGNDSSDDKTNLHIQQDMMLEKRNGKWVFIHSKASMY